MTSVHVAAAARPARPVRFWPGVTLAVLLVILKVVAPLVAPQATPIGVLAGPLLGLLILFWWAVFSRAARVDRWARSSLLLPHSSSHHGFCTCRSRPG